MGSYDDHGYLPSKSMEEISETSAELEKKSYHDRPVLGVVLLMGSSNSTLMELLKEDYG
jgi:hypothetical protein